MQIDPQTVTLSQDGGVHSRGGIVATCRNFCRGFCVPTCMPQGRGRVATVYGPEAGHWGSIPGLGANPWRTGHTEWDFRTQGGPMAWKCGGRGLGSCAISCDGSLVYIYLQSLNLDPYTTVKN